MQRIAAYPRVQVSGDGTGVVSHVGSRLLADVAAAAGLPQSFDEAVGGRRKRCSAHAPGRVLTDLAVLLADGGEAISDLAVLRQQQSLFGPVALAATAWRVLDSGDDTLSGVENRAGRKRGNGPGCCAAEAGRPVPTLTLRRGRGAGPGDRRGRQPGDLPFGEGAGGGDVKKGFGYHPLLVWLDNTNEALAGVLRPGNAGSNTAADHIQITDEALGQIPDDQRGTVNRSWSAATEPAPPRNGWPICAVSATSCGLGICGSRSGSPSSTRSKTPSRYSPKRCGPPRSTRPGWPARSTRRDCPSPSSPS